MVAPSLLFHPFPWAIANKRLNTFNSILYALLLRRQTRLRRFHTEDRGGPSRKHLRQLSCVFPFFYQEPSFPKGRAYNHIPRSGSTVPLCGKIRNLNKSYTHLLTLLAWCYALHTTNSLRERFGQSNDALKGIMLGTVNSTAWAH